MKNFFLHPATISCIVTTVVVGPTAYFYGKSQGQKAATQPVDNSNNNANNNTNSQQQQQKQTS